MVHRLFSFNKLHLTPPAVRQGEAGDQRLNLGAADRKTSATTIRASQLTGMKGAQGFDQDKWPNFADTTFTTELDRRYRIERRDSVGNRQGVDVRVNRSGVDVDIKRN